MMQLYMIRVHENYKFAVHNTTSKPINCVVSKPFLYDIVEPNDVNPWYLCVSQFKVPCSSQQVLYINESNIDQFSVELSCDYVKVDASVPGGINFNYVNTEK
jgi:hypothetical protein